MTEIHGKERVTGITIAEVDGNRKPIPGTEEYYSCDTLLLSVGLIPENELTKGIGVSMNRITSGPNVNDHLQTEAEGSLCLRQRPSCVHDLVDYVSEEANLAGKNAAAYVKKETAGGNKGKSGWKLQTVCVTPCLSLFDIRNMERSGGRAFPGGRYVYKDQLYLCLLRG